MRVWNQSNVNHDIMESKVWSYLWGFETSTENGASEPFRFGVTYEGLKLSRVPETCVSTTCFGVTYEGLNTIGPVPRLSRWVLELPMRVWNRLSAGRLFSEDGSFGVTYEGLKPGLLLSATCFQRFGVTYEGLKRQSGADMSTLDRFWSYLWGLKLATATRRIQVRFGVTYEGLKQSRRRNLRRRSGFGVTYEGLKPEFVMIGGDLMKGFGVTYEGLKPGFMDDLVQCNSMVLELPMRVWNMNNGIRSSVSNTVLELPMRVWNKWYSADIRVPSDSFGVT